MFFFLLFDLFDYLIQNLSGGFGLQYVFGTVDDVYLPVSVCEILIERGAFRKETGILAEEKSRFLATVVIIITVSVAEECAVTASHKKGDNSSLALGKCVETNKIDTSVGSFPGQRLNVLRHVPICHSRICFALFLEPLTQFAVICVQ